MAYKGKYKPSKKYSGDPTKVIYRSLWELSVMKWLDRNPKVKRWSSETVIVPYLCPLDKSPRKTRKYYTDFKIEYCDGRVYVVEVKPKNQTKMPKRPQRQTRKYINEVKRFSKNAAKWKAAKKYCRDRNYIFEIWTEETFKTLGIKIVS